MYRLQIRTFLSKYLFHTLVIKISYYLNSIFLQKQQKLSTSIVNRICNHVWKHAIVKNNLSHNM